MSEAIEVKVKVSNSEQKYVKKFLCYEPITMDKGDINLVAMVEGTVKEFTGPADDVEVVLNMTW